MTDRYNALTVVLSEDIREDDAEPLMAAIRMMKGVQSVKGHIATIDSHIAEQRARLELSEKLWDVLHPERVVK